MTGRELRNHLEQVIWGSDGDMAAAIQILNAEFKEVAEITPLVGLDGVRDICVVVTEPFTSSRWSSYVDETMEEKIGHIPFDLMLYASQVERRYSDGSRYVFKSRTDKGGFYSPQ